MKGLTIGFAPAATTFGIVLNVIFYMYCSRKTKIIIKGFRMKENKKKLTQLFQIFTTFMKIGIFTFGGGYAMIPLIQRETVVKRKWVDDDDILDIVAIAESTPGPIAINASTFVGYRVGGFFGAIVGTVGMILPSL